MSITEIKYQDRPIDQFQQALAAGRLSHAYILAGPTGIGKSSAAMELAKLLLCDRPVQIRRPDGSGSDWRDSCGQCPSCRLVAAGNHPDLHLVYKELIATVSGKQNHMATELGIDVIRQEVIDQVGHKALVGRNKVFIVLEAHLMSRAAQNALLKTLEEPPENTYLFLISEQLAVLLPTIRSRAQALVFSALPESFILERLTQAGASAPAARFLSRFAPGKLGTALELHRLGVYDLKNRLGKDLAALDPAGADDFGQWILDEAKALAERLAQGEGRDESAVRVSASVSASETNRTAIKLFLALIGGFCRDALRLRLGFGENDLVNADQIKTAQALAARFDVEPLQAKIRDLAEAEKWLEANVNVTLTVTNAIAKIVTT